MADETEAVAQFRDELLQTLDAFRLDTSASEHQAYLAPFEK